MADKVEYPRIVKTTEENGVKFVEIEDQMQDKGKTVPFSYVRAADAANLAKLLSNGGELAETAFKRYASAMDLAGRAGNREKVAAESTIVKRDGKDFDLMSLAPAQLCEGINAALAQAKVFGKAVPGAILAARKKLIEGGKATDKGGTLVAAK